MGLAIEHSYQVKGYDHQKPQWGPSLWIPTVGIATGAGGTEPAGGDHAGVVALAGGG